jgi:two-component system response regulator YesN
MHIVVLTCHQDFQYAREAVRYGVLDYIVKTELEDESLHVTIRNIIDRIKRSHALVAPSTQVYKPYGILFMPVLRSMDVVQAAAELVQVLKEGEAPQLLTCSGLFVRSGQCKDVGQSYEPIIAKLGANKWIPFIIRDLPEMPDKTIKNVLEHYMERCMFYEYAFDVTAIEKDWSSLQNEIKQPPTHSLKEVSILWKSFTWIYDDKAFEYLIKHVRELRPSVGEFTAMLQETLSVWRYFVHIAAAAPWQRQQDGFQFWEQWAEWLRDLRPSFKRSNLSDEVSMTVVKAGQLMLDGMKEGLGQAEIAKQVNINRSYFSHCFKQFAGTAFHEMMNALRIDKAMQLLEQTSYPVYMIADQVGFKDDKYFSKFFKHQTGKLPRDIRSHD